MRRIARNPLLVLIGKQLVRESDAELTELVVLICLDAAKRGRAPGALCNTLTEHLLTAVVIWSRMANRKLYDEAVAAYNAMAKASARPTTLLDLTTGEYAAIRAAVWHYVRALPQLEVSLLAYACTTAQAEMLK